jgi:hypothetical protein
MARDVAGQGGLAHAPFGVGDNDHWHCATFMELTTPGLWPECARMWVLTNTG